MREKKIISQLSWLHSDTLVCAISQLSWLHSDTLVCATCETSMVLYLAQFIQPDHY